MIGKLLDGRYQVLQVLSAGGFGETYIAEDTRRPGNPRCVVKLLKPASNDPNYLQTVRRLFKSEAETLEQLGNHDQIPRLLAYFEENQKFYLVQEFIIGHSLATELQPGRYWTESQVIALLKDVLGILAFVHSDGVIHRDLKPGNLIRRTSDNKLVLIDFGAVKQIRTQIAMEPSQMPATVAIGTPGYMPSEQGAGRPQPNSDIYALGIIAIQALTQLYPTQLSDDPRTGELVWQPQAQVSAGLASILSKMVRYDYRTRYQSANAVLQALDELTIPSSVAPTQLPSNPPLPVEPTQRLPVTPIEPNRVPVAPASRTSNPFPWVIGGSLAAVVMAVGAIAFMRSISTPTVSSQNTDSTPTVAVSPSQETTPFTDVTTSPNPSPSKNSTPTEPSPDRSSNSDSTPQDTSSPQNTPSESSSNEFDTAQFPQTNCGDSLPAGSSTATQFYPVFIEYSESNLQTVKSNFCTDAYKKMRSDTGQVAIQVASFTDRSRAESFSEFMQQKVGSGDVGQPTLYSANSNTGTSSSKNCSTVVSDPESPLNVRSAPDATQDNNVVSTLPDKTPISVVAEKDGWLEINSPVQGWVAKNRTKINCQ
ncbi:MAG TPA: protein kinase [Allocoleopsis sp.]